MSAKKNKQFATNNSKKNTANPSIRNANAGDKSKRPSVLQREWEKCHPLIPYILIFILTWTFCTLIYGDVFTRAQQESYVSSSPLSMQYLLNKDFGTIYWIARYVLLVWKNAWVGGLFMAFVLTLSTFVIDRGLRLPRFMWGFSSILSFGLLFWMVYRGYSLFYKNEPSVIVLYPLLLLAGGLLLWGTTAIVGKLSKKQTEALGENANDESQHKKFNAKWATVFIWVPVLLFAGLTLFTRQYRDNEILTASMQNRVLTFEIDEVGQLVDDALLAKQPSRSVAAYYAIGLLHTQQLLDRLFDIEFRYQEMPLDKKDGYEEYGIFQSDGNLFAGLINPAYRTAMDHIVMNGPTLAHLKRLAYCSILNNEPVLAEKYLTMIEQMPFEGEFVDKAKAYLADRTTLEQDPLFASIIKLLPREKKFEQQYRQPIFMGYNVGVLEGTNETLAPSIAACLYSKDFNTLIERAQALKQINSGVLPTAVLEALAIRGMSKPETYQAFPEVNPESQSLTSNATSSLYSFMKDIQTYYETKYAANEWREKMKVDIKGGVPVEVADQLKEKWLGHYLYYYYCENLVKKEEKSNQNASGVN